MTEQTHEEKKARATKALAVFGLLGILVLIAWLSVQVVSLAPNAFSSLASIAEGVYGRSPFVEYQLRLSTGEDVVQSGETTTISWNQAPTDGSFIFSYQCVDGVSVNISTSDDELGGIACDTTYDIGNVTSMTLSAESEKDRFVDMPFTVEFFGQNDARPMTSANEVLTIVNATISPVLVDDTTEVEGPGDAQVSVPTETVSTPSTDNAGASSGYTTTETVTFTQPVSDPNGFTDLKVTYKGVGYIDNNTFVNTGIIDTDEIGAFQFEVENIGTKTSGNWTYTATLPGGQAYNSPVQDPLTPGERYTASLGYRSPEAGNATFDVLVTLADDTNANNNDFTWSATVTN